MMEEELDNDRVEDGDLTMTSSEGEDLINDSESGLIEESSSMSNEESNPSSSSNESSMISLDQSSIINQSWTNYQEQIHQLQLQNRQKDDEITRLKRATMTKQQENEESQLTIRQQYDMQLIKERKTFRQWQQRTQQEIKTLKGQMEILKTQRPIYLKQLREIKSELSGDFEVTMDRYMELKQMDPMEIPLKNWLQVRIYDTIYPIRQRHDRVSLELREIRNAHDRYELDNEELRQEMKKKKKEIMKLRVDLSDLEKEHEETAQQFSEKKQFYDQYRHKSARIEEIESRSTSLEKKCFELQNDLDLKTKELTSCAGEQAGYRKQNQIQRQTIELLKQDKMYLTNEVNLLREQKARLLDSSLLHSTQLDDLKKKRDELFEQLLDHKEGTKVEYEKRMQTEITRLQNAMKLDLEKMKNTHQEIFQNDYTKLQSRHDNLFRENTSLRQELQELRTRITDSSDENKTLTVTSERLLNETKTALQIRNYEYEKLAIDVSQLETQNHNLKIDVAKNEKKVDFLKRAVSELEGRYREQLTELRSEVRIKTTELDGYRKFEEDLDQGIEAIGESVLLEEECEGEGEGEKYQQRRSKQTRTTDQLSQMMSTVPTSHKRRLQYCLTLVKKLSLLEKQNSVQLADLNGKESTIKELLSEKYSLEKRLRQTNQPYSYLVGQLEKADGEIKKQKKMLVGMNLQNKKLKTKVKKLLGVNRILGKDVERLLEQTVQIQKMKKYFEGAERENFLGENNVSQNEEGLISFSKKEQAKNYNNSKLEHRKSV